MSALANLVIVFITSLHDMYIVLLRYSLLERMCMLYLNAALFYIRDLNVLGFCIHSGVLESILTYQGTAVLWYSREFKERWRVLSACRRTYSQRNKQEPQEAEHRVRRGLSI